MPWKITEDDPGCPVSRPWGVRKDDPENELEGCHASEADAEEQMAALYASEEGAVEEEDEEDDRAAEADGTFEPPAAVASAARRALEWIADGKAGDGFTDVGRRRASQLANREPVSRETVGRMANYFGRHASDRDATGFFDDQEGYPTPGRVAWDAWGGDAGRDWATGILEDERSSAVVGFNIRKNHPVDNLLRASADEGSASIGDGNRLFGHFAVFDSWTEIDSAREGRFMERIAPGAFASTFENRADSVRVLYDHGTDPQIGNKPLGVPVSLVEDKRGAFYEVELFDTSYVNELKPALQAGQLGSSFRFRVADESWSSPSRSTQHNPDRLEERTILAVDLFEFGPVTFPAYADATAGLRSRTDEFYEMLNDPRFVVRLTDRLGPKIVEQMIAGVAADGSMSRNKDDRSGVANRPSAPVPDGKLLAAALTEISRRRTR